ncbi:Sec-independent protein translocase subunit TatA [Ornithinimicrobium cavernae]|uniref:Sec-independent protein translocase subunit TatA n=1 Tax=Ornithinimicrobium cavernae TaxID=2666047 RepID=UPI000D693430|nr:Sec-independent protein translocase subunit TatA [Ornithinimicrobium cavernae]
MRPSAWQIIAVVVILILLFGWKSLPNMARSLGQSMRIFKSEVDQMKEPSAASKDTVRGEAADEGDQGSSASQTGTATSQGTGDSRADEAHRDEPRA